MPCESVQPPADPDSSSKQEPQQPIEELVDGAIADRFLRDLYLCLEWGEETVPFEVLTQGTQTGTARGHRDLFRRREVRLDAPAAHRVQGESPVYIWVAAAHCSQPRC